MLDFQHKALLMRADKPLVYTAMSKLNFCYRQYISAFALKQGVVPLNPFMNWDYFLSDLVERDLVREGNNNLVKCADEVWVFGSVSNGVLAEIQMAWELQKPTKFFRIESARDYTSVDLEDVVFEEEVLAFREAFLSSSDATSEK